MPTTYFYFILALTRGSLVDQLGSPLFENRMAAQRALQALGEYAQPALVAGTTTEDPEITRRCEQLLCKLDKFGLRRLPRICYLPEAYDKADVLRRTFLVQSCLNEAQAELGIGVRVSAEEFERRASAHLCRELVKSGWSRAEVRKLLLEMERSELKREGQPASASDRRSPR
jgi:hypothetical protein